MIKELFCGKDWPQVTGNIYKGVLLWQVGNVVHSILGPINNIADAGGNLMSLAQRGTLDMGIGALDVVLWIVSLAIILGYAVFLVGLGQWAPMLGTGDEKAVKQVRLGVILGLAGTVCLMIPFIGWAGSLLNIAAFILMLLGYNSLQNSGTFPAVPAAKKLFMAMILTLVGAVLGFIPLVGGFIEMVLDIVAFFMVLSGWKTIRDTPEPAHTHTHTHDK